MKRSAAAYGCLAALLFVAFIGRSVISADGAEILSVSLAFLVQGRFEAAMMPTKDLLPIPSFHSHYGLFPSLVPLPFLAPVWPIRQLLGAPVVEAASLTWLAGAALAALGFVPSFANGLGLLAAGPSGAGRPLRSRGSRPGPAPARGEEDPLGAGFSRRPHPRAAKGDRASSMLFSLRMTMRAG